jgi:large subunit ribosomal protein L23Ae
VSTAVKKGTHTAKKAKIWHKTTFKRPTTLAQKRSPKVLLKAVKPVITFDKFAVIKHPLSSESAIKTIEDCNTLVFIVHKRATKIMIKKACAELYSIKVKKVNTLITPRGEKKAYVALSSDQDALDIANKIGIM